MAEWVQAEIEFGSLYSYRVPGTSPSYAVCAPVPSPAAIRLALVDAAIRHTGSIDEGRAVFELVKRARLAIQPAERIAVLKFFLKRLKPEKPSKGKRASVLESTGIREYCLPSGCMSLWWNTEEPTLIERSLAWLRRLGTTDSLASCRLARGTPDEALCVREVDGFPLGTNSLSGRVVFTLHELSAGAHFDQVNPYCQGRRGEPFEKRLYIPPLVRERIGQNWVIYRREPFAL